MGSDDAQDRAGDAFRLRLLTYNIQAGTTTTNYRDYVTRGWRQVLPHQQRVNNLDVIAELASQFDIVGLQEVDGGSLRTGFINQTQYLAERAGFPFWSQQSNRRVSKLARTCNGLLSRIRPSEVHDYKLPGRIPGRGALAACYGNGPNALLVIVVHLALGRRSRRSQLAFLREIIQQHLHVVIMGDMNAPLSNAEMIQFIDSSGLSVPANGEHTFPSWRPQRGIDHILISSSLTVERCEVLELSVSDHRPLAMDLCLPGGWQPESAKLKTTADEIDTEQQ